jgi:hypothetical protein
LSVGFVSPSKACSRFINLDRVARRTGFRCPGCKIALCSACAAGHPNMTCDEYQQLPEDEKSPEDYEFRILAHQKRYQRCPQCRRYIEHAGGCEHMVCRCGRSFSYNFNLYANTAPQA